MADALNASEVHQEKRGVVMDHSIDEISGLVSSHRNDGVFWIANDGKKEKLWAISVHGRILMEVSYSGKVKDVEDLGLGKSPEDITVIYISDSGNNDQDRKHLKILAIPEPSVSNSVDLTIVKKVKKRKEVDILFPGRVFDCEALAVDPETGDILLISKEKYRARIFRVSYDQFWSKSKVIAEYLLDVPCSSISAADISSSGESIILRNESTGWLWKKGDQPSLQALFKSRPQLVPVRGKDQFQNGESISFGPKENQYFSISEGRNQPLYEFILR